MKQNKLYILGVVLAFLVCFAFIVHHLGANRIHEVGNSGRVAAVLPLTGSLSFVGQSAQNGMTLALMEHKRSSGENIEFVVVDGKSTIKDSIMAYRHLVAYSKPDALFCVSSLMAKAIAEQNPPMPFLMTIVTDTQITHDKPSWLNLTLNNEQEVNAIIDYLIGLGKKTFAIVYQHDDLGDYTRNTFLARDDIQIVAAEEISDDSQAASIVANICSKQPEAVFIAAVGGTAANMVKKLAELKYNGEIASFSGFNTPSVLRQAGVAANGLIICCTQYESGRSEAVKQFKRSYFSEFNADPDFIAAYAYSLMSIYLTSQQNCTHYQTLFGEVDREDNGSMHFQLEIARLKDGGLVVE